MIIFAFGGGADIPIFQIHGCYHYYGMDFTIGCRKGSKYCEEMKADIFV